MERSDHVEQEMAGKRKESVWQKRGVSCCQTKKMLAEKARYKMSKRQENKRKKKKQTDPDKVLEED